MRDGRYTITHMEQKVCVSIENIWTQKKNTQRAAVVKFICMSAGTAVLRTCITYRKSVSSKILLFIFESESASLLKKNSVRAIADSTFARLYDASDTILTHIHMLNRFLVWRDFLKIPFRLSEKFVWTTLYTYRRTDNVWYSYTRNRSVQLKSLA